MNILKWRGFPHTLKKKVLKLFRYRPQSFTYVAIGDSTAEGMGASLPERAYTNLVYASLKSRYKTAKYHNFARSGAILKDVIKTQLPKALDEKPSLVTISVGANDIIRRTKVTDFEKDLTYLLKTLQQKTDAIIVISTIPDLSLIPSIPRLLKKYSQYKAGKLNAVILKVGKDTGTVTVDLFEDSRVILEAYPEAIASDGFHPSDFGYAIWANTILVTLRKALAPIPEEKEEKN